MILAFEANSAAASLNYIFFSNFSLKYVHLNFRIPRSNSYSRDKSYLNVPPNRNIRERGTSLPDNPQTGTGSRRSHTIDLYRLREFTVKNNRIISHTESLQPRYGRSSNSINSSASRYVWFSDGQVGYPKIWVIRPPGYRYLRGTARNMSFYKYPTRWILEHKYPNKYQLQHFNV